MTGTVLVTGGSGYIAGFVIRQLSEAGWTIHTTVRNLGKEHHYREILAVDNSRLHFFQADLTNDYGWERAMIHCTHVCHMASPLPSSVPKDPNELIVPAREGALRALRFAHAAGIKRFVMTSSAAAIAYGHGKGQHRFTEADWTNVDHPDAYPYVQSKTIAERAARDWVAANAPDMEFVSVNPSLVLGPLLSTDFSTSIEAIRKMLAGDFPGIPNFGFGVVDVRDVAHMHVQCLTAPAMAGERFIASGPFMMMGEIAAVLKAGLGDRARKVPTRRLPDFLVKLTAMFDPVVKQVVGELGNVREMDAGHARNVLGWHSRPSAETILDTANSLFEHGLVKV